MSPTVEYWVISKILGYFVIAKDKKIKAFRSVSDDKVSEFFCMTDVFCGFFLMFRCRKYTFRAENKATQYFGCLVPCFCLWQTQIPKKKRHKKQKSRFRVQKSVCTRLCTRLYPGVLFVPVFFLCIFLLNLHVTRKKWQAFFLLFAFPELKQS